MPDLNVDIVRRSIASLRSKLPITSGEVRHDDIEAYGHVIAFHYTLLNWQQDEPVSESDRNVLEQQAIQAIQAACGDSTNRFMSSKGVLFDFHFYGANGKLVSGMEVTPLDCSRAANAPSPEFR